MGETTTAVPRVSGFYERRRDGTPYAEYVEVVCRDGNDYALIAYPNRPSDLTTLSYDSPSYEWSTPSRRRKWQMNRAKRAEARYQAQRFHQLALENFARAVQCEAAMAQLRAPFTGQRDHVGAVHGFVVACVRVALEDAYQRGFDDAY